DVPFAIPFEGVAFGVGGQGGHVLLDGVAGGGAELVHLGAEFEDGVDRAFHGAGNVAGDIGDGHQILVVNALVLDGGLRVDEFAEGNELARAAGDFQALEAGEVGAAGAIEPDGEGDVFLGSVHVQESGRVAG